LGKQTPDLHKQVATAKTPDANPRLQRRIEATHRNIDQLV